MAKHVKEHCQKSKLTIPQHAPLQNVLIGQLWQMIALMCSKYHSQPTTINSYLLVLQDYFTKWADAIPMPDQTAARITSELIKFFCTYGPPQILHSDQGRNFESSIFTCFQYTKVSYHSIPLSRGWDGRTL